MNVGTARRKGWHFVASLAGAVAGAIVEFALAFNGAPLVTILGTGFAAALGAVIATRWPVLVGFGVTFAAASLALGFMTALFRLY